MPDLSANLSLPLLLPAQAQKHVTHNEALQVLDALVQLVVLDRGRTTPPAAPAEGDRHIVPAGATGGPTGWTGPAGSVAVFAQGGWMHHLPRPGWRAHVLAEDRDLIWTGTDWALPDLQSATLGVNTAGDATNRLAVAAPASLFTHAGAGHQIKVNKAAAGDTASLLFQTGFSGRAEMGLAGSDGFSVKVSADGATWTEALGTEPATGRLRAPAGLQVTGSVTGTAVQTDAADTTAGRLLKTGAGGLLGPALNLGVAGDFDTVTGGAFFGNAAQAPDAPGNVPVSGQSHAGVVTRLTAGRALQVAANLTGAPSRLWWRGQNTTWGAWRYAFDSGNVLGAVAQSGGLPTGALIERASNANGHYLRFADGTQICISDALTADITTAVGAGFRSAVQNWTFPAVFATTTGLIVVADGVNNSATHWASGRAASATLAELTAHGWQSVTGRAMRGLAIGRWF